MRDLISIVMCVKNGEKYLRKSIDSILDQTFRDYEFVIINDGSTDDTSRILDEYAEKDSRIRIYHQDTRGVCVSLNKAIGVAKGNYIARQDSDDISSPRRLEIEYNYLQENTDIDLVGTYATIIDEKDNFVKSLQFPTDKLELKEYIKKKNPFVAGSVLMRKECLVSSGLFREQFLLGQHVDLWCRIAEKHNIANIPQFLYQYRLWEDAVSNEKAALFSFFSDLAFEFAQQRREKGIDLLMKGNNYEFYEKYAQQIIRLLDTEEPYRWLVTNP